MLAYYAQYKMHSALKKIAQLNQVLFNGYLQVDYLKNKTSNDKKVDYLYFQWTKTLLALEKFKKNINMKRQLKKIKRLSEVIFAVHQLRLRIKDFSIFEIVAREMFALQKTSTACLLNSKKNNEDYLQTIHAFESIYERTLRVSAQDPLVFLIFIQDLYEFYDVMQLEDK